jgi:hypothetical protein
VWTNPRYRELTGQEPPGRATAEAPEPTGETLASFPRKGSDGTEQELRVVLDEYQGHPYIAVRLWSIDRDTGAWWPVKGKGISVRLSEAQGVAEALTRALDLVEQPPPREPPRGRRERPDRRADWRGHGDGPIPPPDPAGGHDDAY